MPESHPGDEAAPGSVNGPAAAKGAKGKGRGKIALAAATRSSVAIDHSAEFATLDRSRIFRQGEYPYRKSMGATEYEALLYPLQAELVKAQNWIKDQGQKVIALFEGRDAAGKGGTIKRFMEHLNPRGARVVALDKPNETERGAVVFPALRRTLPDRRRDRLFRPLLVQPGRRGAGHWLLLVERSTSSSSAKLPNWNGCSSIAGSGCTSTGSPSQDEQRRRFPAREIDPLRQWKLSPNRPGLYGQVE